MAKAEKRGKVSSLPRQIETAVQAAEDKVGGGMNANAPARYVTTFYPGAVDRSQATIVGHSSSNGV